MRRRELLASLASLPAAGMPPQASPAFPQPDLGNLSEIVDWISSQNPREYSFLHPRWKRLEEWKKSGRTLFRRLLSYSPAPKPLAGNVVRREERDGFTVETVRISATAAYDIPARVLIPHKRTGRGPALVAIHCHGGCYVFGHEKILSNAAEPEAARKYRERAYGRPYVELLARQGYVVLVIDGFYFGERRLKVEELDPKTAPPSIRERLQKLAETKPRTTEWFAAVDRACGEYEHLTAKTIFSAGATWPGILVWDDMRSVDYLASRAEVDPNRIGCVGLSIGGLRTAHLIAADPRIKAACVVGWMTQFHTQLRNHLRNHTWMIYVPGLYAAMDLTDAAALTAPGALMVLQCSRDALYPLGGMQGSVEALERIFRKAGIPEKFKGSFYDVPHSFTPEMQEEAFAWFRRWL